MELFPVHPFASEMKASLQKLQSPSTSSFVGFVVTHESLELGSKKPTHGSPSLGSKNSGFLDEVPVQLDCQVLALCYFYGSSLHVNYVDHANRAYLVKL